MELVQVQKNCRLRSICYSEENFLPRRQVLLDCMEHQYAISRGSQRNFITICVEAKAWFSPSNINMQQHKWGPNA